MNAGKARYDVYVWTRSELDVPANECAMSAREGHQVQIFVHL